MLKKAFKLKLITLIILILTVSIPLNAQGKILTLKEVLNLTLKNYPKLKSIKFQLEAEKLEKRSISLQRLPKVKSLFQFQRFNQPVTLVPISKPGKFPPFTTEVYSWELNLSFPIYLGGILSKRAEIKGLQIKSSKLMLNLTKQQVIANVSVLYYQVLYYKSLISTVNELLLSLKKQRDLAKLRYEQGKIPKLDLLHFDELISEQKAILESCKQDLKYAKKLLGLFMGLSNGNFTVLGSLSRYRLPSLLHFSLEKDIYQRPDVKIAKIRLKQAKKSLELVKHEFYPKVYAFSSYGYRYSSGFNNPSELWSVGLRLEFDIFDSGVRIYRFLEKEKRIAASEFELRNTLLKAKEEVISALKLINQALSQIDSLKAAIKFAKESYEVEAIRYKEGAGSITDLLLAQQALLNVRIKLLKAYFDLQRAIVNYELATGNILKEVKP